MPRLQSAEHDHLGIRCPQLQFRDGNDYRACSSEHHTGRAAVSEASRPRAGEQAPIAQQHSLHVSTLQQQRYNITDNMCLKSDTRCPQPRCQFRVAPHLQHEAACVSGAGGMLNGGVEACWWRQGPLQGKHYGEHQGRQPPRSGHHQQVHMTTPSAQPSDMLDRGRRQLLRNTLQPPCPGDIRHCGGQVLSASSIRLGGCSRVSLPPSS